MINNPVALGPITGVAIACAGTARAMRPGTAEAAVRLRAAVIPLARMLGVKP